MLLVTVLGIGSAAWWRWPVTQTTESKQGTRELKETFTYHRGLHGELIKHGVHRTSLNGVVELEEYYREGVRHGSYQKVGIVKGEYLSGKRNGLWEFTWNEHSFTYEFKQDRLVAAPKSLSGKLLLRRIAEGSLIDEKLTKAILADVDVYYSEMDLKYVSEEIKKRFGIPLAPRWKRKVIPKVPSRAIEDTPIYVNLEQWPLLASFDAMFAPLGLSLDYRYGTLCVVDAEGAEDWRDMTGIKELRPPSETSLAARLDSIANPTRLERLRNVLRNLTVEQGIHVEFRIADDAEVILPSIPVDEMVQLPSGALLVRNDPIIKLKTPPPITLHQLLRLLLDQANLHCHEENGVLIIEPPQNVRATEAKASSPK